MFTHMKVTRLRTASVSFLYYFSLWIKGLIRFTWFSAKG